MFLLQAMASAVTAAGAVCWGGHLNVRPVLEVGLALVVCVANYDIKSAKLCTGKLRFISSTGASKMSSSRRSCLQQRYCGGRESQKLSATRNLPVKGWAFAACATVTITMISGARNSKVTFSRRKPLSCLPYIADRAGIIYFKTQQPALPRLPADTADMQTQRK